MEKKHVLVFSFPFGTHARPLLNLILKLAHATPSIHFSFVGTKHSNEPLLSKPHTPSSVSFFTLSEEEVSEDSNAPPSHPVQLVNRFLLSCSASFPLAADSAAAKTGLKVTCVLADAFVAPYSLEVARSLSVPWIPVWPPLSSSLCAHFHTHLIRNAFPKGVSGDTALDLVPALAKFRVEDLPEDIIRVNGEEKEKEKEETVFSKTLASLGSVLPQAKAVVVNFFEELDPPLLAEDMRSKFESLLYVGFLTLSLPVPPLPPSHTDETGCLSWLDKHGADGTVVYVAFGTVVTPPPHEIVAVAEALEESEFPFLWSLKDDVKELLPNGFLERTKNRGKLVSWAPQSVLLGHGSIGVFVTHAGCNSVFESMSNGVPLICRPFFGDHGMTSRMIEDVWEIGIRVEGGVFTKHGLLKNLNLVLVEEEGKKMKENAVKVKKIVLDAAGPEGKAAQDFKTLVELLSNSNKC